MNGVGSALLERPQVAFDALEPVFQVSLHIENRLVVEQRAELAHEEIQRLFGLEGTHVQLEAVFEETLDGPRRALALGAVEFEDRGLVLLACHGAYQRPSQETKFCSSCRPWLWLFSGWNCTAKREPSASAAAKSTP